jgi:hypothetical protein
MRRSVSAGLAKEGIMSVRMSSGDAIVESLLLHGVEAFFAIPSVKIYDLFDSLCRRPSLPYDKKPGD